ncbi:glycosyltransferase [Rothia sp. ARF10]|nr:glycosyltransferase [Rothia sp. ARF10]
MRVGWYVHHHGAGHRTRARVLADEMATRGHRVTLLGSGRESSGAFPKLVDTVALSMDSPLDGAGPERRADVTVGGLLHWAPLRHSGFRDRMTHLAAWVREHQPDVFVVDVSSEVAVLVRLLGVPVVVVAQPGDRRDAGHRAALAAASAVLAPWPEWATTDLWRTGVSTGQQEDSSAVVAAVGGITRTPEPALEGTPEPAPDASAGSASAVRAVRTSVTPRLRGLVLAGAEGFDTPGLVDAVTRSVTDVDWMVADGRHWVPDVRRALSGTDVVVTHAGQNAVAEVALAGVPAVVVPQQRPFGEQDHMGACLAASGLAVVVPRRAVGETEWAGTVARALRTGGGAWARWGCEGAVARAVDVLEGVAHG